MKTESMTIEFHNNRPEGFTNTEDRYLVPLIDEINKLITDIQHLYGHNTLKCDKKRRQVLSTLIIEFAEDLHNSIGLWHSVEYYNKQLFNTPLPLFLNSENEIRGVFDVNRMKCFMHTLFGEFNPETVIAPYHKDLELLAKTVSAFLSDRFQRVPHRSGIREFLSQPNEAGWDIKRKLLWVGTRSYLFRIGFHRYLTENNKGKMDIASMDDFICQENTLWSGLGVIDVLAKTLDLPAKMADDVRSWYDRYVSYYRVISSTDSTLTVENLVNETRYTLRSDIQQNSVFTVGKTFFGGIVPYGDYWYWSGAQRDWGKLGKHAVDEVKREFIRKSSRAVYRYDKQRLAKAKERLNIEYEDFITFFGSQFTTFKDGLSMAAALQKKDRKKYEALPKHELEAHLKRHGLLNPFPRMNLPDTLLNSINGVGVYFNRDEGMEIMTGFDDLLSGFKKEGEELTEDECEVMRRFITSDCISPAFVRTMVGRHGGQSINASFLIDGKMNVTEYLLHKYKGQYFRNRYPEISFTS